MSADDVKGYDVETLTDPPETVFCPLCTLLIKNAVQTNRGERACKDCFTNASKELKKGECPIDGGENTITFKDKYTDKQVLALHVFCQYKNNGCGWNGILKEMLVHIEQCQFKDKRDVEMRMSKEEACPWKCGVNVALEDMKKHIEECTLASSNTCCAFTSFGCDFQGNESIKDHMVSNANQHAKLITVEIMNYKHSMDETDKKLHEQQELIDSLNKKLIIEVKKNANMKKEFNDTVKDYIEKINRSDEQRISVEKRMQADIDMLKELVGEFSEFKKSLRRLESSSGNEAPSKTNEKTPVQQQAQGVAAETRKSVEECKLKVKVCEDTCGNIRRSVDELDLKQQLLENTCYGGKFLWKIDNLANRIAQAQKGQVTALHSAPCFTKKFGYKFCTRLYLNGDGVGKRSHVSLFFVLMRSEYDVLLEWPFKQRVSFKLINTSNESLSICESFTPDEKSTSFRRPKRDMNVAAGCPKFVLQNELKNFIVDDSIYIETTVEDVK